MPDASAGTFFITFLLHMKAEETEAQKGCIASLRSISSSRSPKPASSALPCSPQRATQRHHLCSGISENDSNFLLTSSDLPSRTLIAPSSCPLDNSSWMNHGPCELASSNAALAGPSCMWASALPHNMYKERNKDQLSAQTHSFELNLTP